MFLLTRSDDPIRQLFYSSLRQAYKCGDKYILSKLPLQNEVLKLHSFIDPPCQKSTVTAEMMKKLRTYLSTVISQNEEYDALDRKIDKFYLHGKSHKLNGGNPKQLDKRWAEVFQMKRFPWLSKLKNHICLSLVV